MLTDRKYIKEGGDDRTLLYVCNSLYVRPRCLNYKRRTTHNIEFSETRGIKKKYPGLIK
jgi:hypothetical protein